MKLFKQRFLVRGGAEARILHTDWGLCGCNLKPVPEEGALDFLISLSRCGHKERRRGKEA